MPPAPAPDLGLAGERRQLTVFFCDLVGSMELAARLDPEDWPDVLWTYRTRAGEVVARHGGHVAQYFGDGILIYFGWPNTYDDTAELTARAALGLVEVAATGVRTAPCFPCASGSTPAPSWCAPEDTAAESSGRSNAGLRHSRVGGDGGAARGLSQSHAAHAARD